MPLALVTPAFRRLADTHAWGDGIVFGREGGKVNMRELDSESRPESWHLPAVDPRVDRVVDLAVDPLLRDTVAQRLFGTKGAALRVGRYVVLRRVGAGGMGVVYAAYDEELDRKVALKVIRTDLLDEAARRRALLEGRAMAKLSHPNVVQVYDVGEHEGNVFLAMEFVRGTNLVEWLAAAPRPTRAVVEVFVEAARGLTAAHAAGLIHRDVKPANILVDETGRARIGDFGTARATGPDDLVRAPALGPTDDPAALRHSGTPAYMAPEQREGRAIDARSDQYALCSALREALRSTGPKSRGDALRARVLRVAARGTSTDPSRRYPSMDALVAALVAAQRRRRRFTLLGVGSTLGATVSFLAATHDPCAQATTRLDAIWSPTRAEALTEALAKAGPAEQGSPLATYVRDEFDRFATAWRTESREACRATHVDRVQSRELLDARYACLDRAAQRFDALVRVAETSEDSAPRVHDRQDLLRSLPTLEECRPSEQLLTRVPAWPTDAALRGPVEEIRRGLDEGAGLVAVGDYRAALDLVRVLHDRARALDFAPIQVEATLALGTALRSAENTPVATIVETLLQAVDLAEASGHDRGAATGWVALVGLAGSRLGDQPRGDEWLRRAEASVRRLGDPTDLRARLSTTTGQLHFVAGRLAEAEAAATRAVELRRAEERAGSELDLANALHGLGIVRQRRMALASAEEAYEEALAIRTRRLGDRHPEVADLRLNLGVLAFEAGQHAQALTDLHAARSVFDEVYGRDSAASATADWWLAAEAMTEGRLDDAYATATAALATFERSGDPYRAHTKLLLARIALAAARPDEALRTVRDALALQATLSKSRVEALEMHVLEAEILTALGDVTSARARIDALQPSLEVLHPSHGARVHALTCAAELLERQGDRKEALATWRAAQTAIAPFRLREPALTQRIDARIDALEFQPFNPSSTLITRR